MKYRGGNLQCHDDHAMLQVWIMGFWVNNACRLVGGYQCLERTWSLCLFPEDGVSRFDYFIGNHLPDYMVSWPRRPHSKFSPLWKSRIWNIPWREMEVSGHILTALSPGRDTPVYHWIGGCVGHRSGLNNVEKRKISAPTLYWATSPLYATSCIVTVLNVLSQLQQEIKNCYY
jgi:hypothetical protein